MPVGYYTWVRGSEQVIPSPDGKEKQERIDELIAAYVQCHRIRLIIEPDPYISSRESRRIDDTCDELYSRLLDGIKSKR